MALILDVGGDGSNDEFPSFPAMDGPPLPALITSG
jgi:hypothetical protein